MYGPCNGLEILECEFLFLEADSNYALFDGMTFQVDIFLGDFNYGLRLEDGIVVRKGGIEEFAPQYLEIIEL